MGCVNIGKLRAYCDGELASAEAVKVEGHLTECARCAAQLEDMRHDSLMVSSKLSMLAPKETESPVDPDVALARLRQELAPRTGRQGVAGWFGALLSGPGFEWRPLAAGLATVAVVAALLALPPVRSAAVGLLSVFRVQEFAAVTVDPSTLSNVPMLDPTMIGSFEAGSQAPKTYSGLSVLEAAAKVDFPVRLPSQLPAGLATEPKLSVTDSFSFAFTFDLAKAQAYLESVGIRGVTLPKTLDGQRVSASVPAHIFVQYSGRADGTGKLEMVEGRSPLLDIPDAVNVEEVRDAVLSYPGLPTELVVQLRALDWKTTAPVPVVKGDTSRRVMVDGVEGLLIQSGTQKINILMWQKEGVVVALVGQVSDAELIAAADSMR